MSSVSAEERVRPTSTLARSYLITARRRIPKCDCSMDLGAGAGGMAQVAGGCLPDIGPRGTGGQLEGTGESRPRVVRIARWARGGRGAALAAIRAIGLKLESNGGKRACSGKWRRKVTAAGELVDEPRRERPTVRKRSDVFGATSHQSRNRWVSTRRSAWRARGCSPNRHTNDGMGAWRRPATTSSSSARTCGREAAAVSSASCVSVARVFV